MIRIGVIGDIGAGKTFVANNFGYPVFNADFEVSKLYRNNKKIFFKLNKILPNYITSFPIDKNEITNAILINNKNLQKIINIVHKEIRKKLNLFLKKNINKKIVVLDIPLLLENKINKKSDVLVFVDSEKKKINKRLKERKGYNLKIVKKFRKIQLNPNFKKKKSNYILKNNFTEKSVKKQIRKILDQIE